MAKPDFGATILRTTATELLEKDIPTDLSDEQLLALYAYATSEKIVGGGKVSVNTIALLTVIEWVTTNPKAYEVLQGIKAKFGHESVGYQTYFVRALSEASSQS